MSHIYDNIQSMVVDGLNDIVSNQGVLRADFCVGYFNLRGWGPVAPLIDQLDGETIVEGEQSVHRWCRLLVGMNRPPEQLIKELYDQKQHLIDSDYAKRCRRRMAEQFRRQLELGIPDKGSEEALQTLLRQLKEGRVCVKLHLRTPLHAKLYLAHRPNDNFNKVQSIMGSSNLTYNGLKGQGELNAGFGDPDDGKKMAQWFNDRWEDRYSLDITDDLIYVIEHSWASDIPLPPYYVYIKTAYHLSRDARKGIGEFKLPAIFRQELFDFQQIAVKIVARHLMNDRRGGAMIGDVVGLGKTITACAVIKLFEDAFGGSALIICPANLQDMWQRKYVDRYDLKAQVWSMSKTIDVENTRRYRLIVIDESHNLRNSEGRRYHNIRDLINYQDCKVLLLTATPYNMAFTDLSSQLRLFIKDDQDLGIRPESLIRHLKSDREFQRQHPDIYIRSIRAFEQSTFVDDWNELMRLFLVRRTRTFVKQNYAEKDPKTGRFFLRFPDGTESFFPDRIPHSITFPTLPGDQYSRLYSQQMMDIMGDLVLPRYGLSQYVDEKKKTEATKAESRLLDNLSRAGQRMMGFCRSTFFKRMDSCGFVFLQTLYRHALRNMLFVYAIENHLPLPIGDENQLPDDYLEDEDINAIPGEVEHTTTPKGLPDLPVDIEEYRRRAERYYRFLQNKNNVDWLDSRYFKRSLKQRLLNDSLAIIDMMKLCGTWDPEQDQKLSSLRNLITDTHPNEKILVFTQYSDTARYVESQLRLSGITHTACVTGDSTDITAQVELFSPVSSKARIIPPKNEQTRVLITTDVLSEGQNLHDAHIVVNYDLPWAIIRLIQRAGRVDRIGQKSETIDCYSFFPADGVEQLIGLKHRLNDRINENAQVVGSDEIFFEGNDQNLRDLYNEKSGILDDESDDDVDLASYAFQIWKNAIDKHPELAQTIPSLNNNIYSTKAVDDENRQGVVTYARTASDTDLLTWLSPEGEIVSQSQKRILKAMECDFDTPAQQAIENHHSLVAKSLKMAQDENRTLAQGMLGSRLSTRYRIVNKMQDYNSREADLFHDNDRKQLLERAIDQMYNNQLTESSRYMLTKMLKNAQEDELADTVIDLYRENKLCLVNDEKNDPEEPTIICSMGLTQQT